MMDSVSKSLNVEDYFSTDHLRASLKKRTLRGAGATVFSQITTYSIQMISTIVLARLLTPDDFGLIAMVICIFQFFMMYRNLGLTEATIQRQEINHKQISTLFWINVAFGLAMTLILVAVAPLVAWFYEKPQLKLITIVIAPAFLFGSLATQHLALLKRNMQFYRYAANEIIASIISVIIAISLAWQGWGCWALVARRLSLVLATTLGAWIFCQWRPGMPAFGTGILPMLKFGINTLGYYTVNLFSRNLDKILIGWRYGTQSLGYYDKAYHLFIAPAQQLSFPLTGVAVATLSRLCNEPEKYRRYYLNAVSMLAFIGMPMSAMLTVMGNDIILLLLGPQWNKAGEIFSVFGLGIGIQLLYATHGWLHTSLDRTDRWLRWAIIGSIVTIVSFMIGLPFGALGVAIAYTSSLYVLIGPCLWYAGRPIDIKFSSLLSAVWKYYVSAFGAGLLCWFVLHSFDLTSGIFMGFNIFVRLFLSCVLCIFLYILLVVALYQNTKPISRFISVLLDMRPMA